MGVGGTGELVGVGGADISVGVWRAGLGLDMEGRGSASRVGEDIRTGLSVVVDSLHEDKNNKARSTRITFKTFGMNNLP